MLLSISFLINDTPTTEIYTLSLHDALPICQLEEQQRQALRRPRAHGDVGTGDGDPIRMRNGARLEQAAQLNPRSEEHTSELQSRQYLVCRLLLEKKKEKTKKKATTRTTEIR